MDALKKKLTAAIGEKDTNELLGLIEKYIDRDPQAFKKKLGMLKMFLK